MTTARRIAEEMGVELGGVVGYHVRYDKCASSSTVIKVRFCGGSDGDGDGDGGGGVCVLVLLLLCRRRLCRTLLRLLLSKVVTDGILLREMQSDFMLTKYRRVCCPCDA